MDINMGTCNKKDCSYCRGITDPSLVTTKQMEEALSILGNEHKKQQTNKQYKKRFNKIKR
jgi:hypothetical protein